MPECAHARAQKGKKEERNVCMDKQLLLRRTELITSSVLEESYRNHPIFQQLQQQSIKMHARVKYGPEQ